jgi:hypothetical protein
VPPNPADTIAAAVHHILSAGNIHHGR